MKFGPDVDWLDPTVSEPDDDFYSVDEAKIEDLKAKFSSAIKNYIPSFSEFGELQYDYAGVRPKLNHPDAREGDFDGGGDFWIRQDSVGFINLFGIESPGVTSSLAIGEEVIKMIDKRNIMKSL